LLKRSPSGTVDNKPTYFSCTVPRYITELRRTTMNWRRQEQLMRMGTNIWTILRIALPLKHELCHNLQLLLRRQDIVPAKTVELKKNSQITKKRTI